MDAVRSALTLPAKRTVTLCHPIDMARTENDLTALASRERQVDLYLEGKSLCLRRLDRPANRIGADPREKAAFAKDLFFGPAKEINESLIRQAHLAGPPNPCQHDDNAMLAALKGSVGGAALAIALAARWRSGWNLIGACFLGAATGSLTMLALSIDTFLHDILVYRSVEQLEQMYRAHDALVNGPANQALHELFVVLERKLTTPLQEPAQLAFAELTRKVALQDVPQLDAVTHLLLVDSVVNNDATPSIHEASLEDSWLRPEVMFVILIIAILLFPDTNSAGKLPLRMGM